MINSVKKVYLSLGTNQGNKEENLQKAVNQIAIKVGVVSKVSSIYKTPSWGFLGNHFYNICLEVLTRKTPENILKSILKIEKSLGRQPKKSIEYENRIIDIDVLLYEQEIILSKDLAIPHPRMLQRKFVLVPLAEIAPTILHPTEKNELLHCLQNCTDSSKISKVSIVLKKPIDLKEKYNYIAIEGNIGAGKTSLVSMISEDFKAKRVLEQFSENPFLPKFYKNQKRYAFPLEMSFLADRYQQLTNDLSNSIMGNNLILSDYYIFKSLLFAQITLQKDEYILYRKVFDIMYKEITKPNLYVYLHQNTERLLQNIKKRGRDYEKNITTSYLEKIHNGYLNFFDSEKKLPILFIDISKMDFLKNTSDYYTILHKITKF